jgi:hypothetical protein
MSRNYPIGDLPSVPPKLKASATTNAFPNKNHDMMNTFYNKCLEAIREGYKFPIYVNHRYTLFDLDDDVKEQILNKIKARLTL